MRGARKTHRTKERIVLTADVALHFKTHHRNSWGLTAKIRVSYRFKTYEEAVMWVTHHSLGMLDDEGQHTSFCIRRLAYVKCLSPLIVSYSGVITPVKLVREKIRKGMMISREVHTYG